MTTALSQPNTSDQPPPPTAPIHHHLSTSSRGQNSYNSSAVARSQSTRNRPAANNTSTSPSTGPLPHRAASTSSHSRHPSSASGRPAEEILPEKDYETSNVAQYAKQQQQPPPATSRERPPPAYRNDSASSSSRQHRRESSKTTTSAGGAAAATTGAAAAVAAAEMAGGNTAVANNAGPAPVAAGGDPRQHQQKHSRSRTTIPTQSGKWILGKTIGAGSMGKVKLARKEDGSEQVACKIIPRGSPDDGHHNRADKERADQSKEIRTAREAAIVTLLNHPHICGLRDVVRTNYHWYMLFEYVNGGQMLDYIISHGKLKEKQARKFSRQIASALDYCHRNSVVHRDLKIENILISKTGDIKIIDFGLSNLFAPRGHLKTFCGSLYFAAPELLQARAYTGPEVDVWSFGIVLYVLVCGKVPFDDQSMPALHAKIKKGLVDYPNWLSNECKHLLSRMLVTDPKQRATMAEVMSHPWMTKGYNAPPENFLPHREALSLPLDNDVINNMTGFNFGPPDLIKSQLTRTIESEDYQRAVRMLQREKELPQPPKDVEKKRGFGFDFYKRRNSMNSRDTLTNPSSEVLQIGNDPLNAFSPLVSIYYLVREKQDRDRAELAGASGTVAPAPPEKGAAANEKKAAAAGAGADPGEIAPPAPAHVNSGAYEMPGEKPTGGRSRPRARTHGEDEAGSAAAAAAVVAGEASGAGKTPLSPSGPRSPDMLLQADAHQHTKKESMGAILRRFSTRRRAKEPERLDRDRSHPPVVQVSPAAAGAGAGAGGVGGDGGASSVPATPRKSFSIRRSRRDHDELSEARMRGAGGSSQPHHSELLSPPLSAGANAHSYGAGGGGAMGKKGLGRSTSVNSGSDFRRRIAKEPPPTSGSDQSASGVVLHEKPFHEPPVPKLAAAFAAGGGVVATAAAAAGASGNAGPATATLGPKSASMRAKSLGHARRESIAARRRQREESAREANLPEEEGAGQHHRENHNRYLAGPSDADEAEGGLSGRGSDEERLDAEELAKPVFLKGLFSVSTTSGKSVPEIRAEVRRVLPHLGVEYTEIRGGFSCRHAPSIDLKKVANEPLPPNSPTPGGSGSYTPGGHKRRFSLGLVGGGSDPQRDDLHELERDRNPNANPPITPRTPAGNGKGIDDRSFSNSDISADDADHVARYNSGAAVQHHNSYDQRAGNAESSSSSRPRAPGGETTTQVQNDLGGSMVLEFEIFIVKVPLLSLHGIQFKRMVGNTWQFKNLADQILKELRL